MQQAKLLSKPTALNRFPAQAPRQATQAMAVMGPLLQADRRAAMGLLLGTAALVAGAQPSQAAYGESARVFAGGPTNATGFTPYVGDGFALLLPSKYQPAQYAEFPGTVLRYEDSLDVVNNLLVIKKDVNAGSIEALGSPEKFLQEISYVFGSPAAYDGETVSEGGFLPNKVAAVSVLDVGEATDKKGRKYYRYDVLSRTADGNEGGRHHLIAATVADNKLYICKVQVGDKRWIRGEGKNAQTAIDSFVVA